MGARGVLERATALVVGLLLLGLVSCTDDAGSDDSTEAASSPTPTSSSSSPTSPPPSTPACPNPEGGSCLGPLRPRTSYTTVTFQPAITYEVPRGGWANGEDLFGNFLLVPPGNDLEGVNAGTSDYLGVYRGVLPSRLASPVCGAEWPLGEESGPTPAAMLRYYQRQRDLTVSHVRRVEIDGRQGVVLDLEAAPGVPLDHCREGTTRVEVTSVISGVDGSGLDHGVIRDMTMRLYLLEDAGRVMAVELTDVHAAPGTADGMSRVAEGLRFARP